jgi:hypothetical protein|tara:strand:- start:939 stop:1199 length:261 start_codon:yes stop_codon:yes gene_type:complete
MKSNKLKNIFLGIIAINLTLITLIQLNIWPSTANATDLNANYGLVPLNEDGSINVRLSASDVIDVNIDEVGGGYVSYGKLKVEIVN